MTHLTIGEFMSLSLMPIIKTVRRWRIKATLRNLDYQLAHIAATRANDFAVERLVHKHQVMLQSELRQLEAR